MRGGEELDDLDELQRRFLAALSDPAAARASRRALLRTLPWHTRMRLWFTRQRDCFACWLIDHHQIRTAEIVWRIR